MFWRGSVFVIGEIALSLALLAGAGLFIKSFMHLQQIDPGVQSEDILTVRVVLPAVRYSQPEQVRAFFRGLLERVTTVPGVEAAGAISGLPLSGTGGSD
ncbi:MAG: hypothetical protein HY646_03675 [Acidobacteria bacterium]|nr:hypothetical protein [Acidobacteriota bacterium]